MNKQLPPGWTVEEKRFLWALCKDGKPRSYAGTEEAAYRAINLQREFYKGDVIVANTTPHVDL